MGYTNDYDLPEWEHPSDYGGFSPDGDFIIASVHRDSTLLERCNWESWQEFQNEMNAKHEARDNPDLVSGEDTTYVYEFRASHWAVGWVDYMLIRRDAPDEIQAKAYEMLGALADYPILDEEKFSNMEHEEAQELWEDSDEEDREYWLKQADLDLALASEECYPEGLHGYLIADL